MHRSPCHVNHGPRRHDRIVVGVDLDPTGFVLRRSFDDSTQCRAECLGAEADAEHRDAVVVGGAEHVELVVDPRADHLDVVDAVRRPERNDELEVGRVGNDPVAVARRAHEPGVELVSVMLEAVGDESRRTVFPVLDDQRRRHGRQPTGAPFARGRLVGWMASTTSAVWRGSVRSRSNPTSRCSTRTGNGARSGSAPRPDRHCGTPAERSVTASSGWTRGTTSRRRTTSTG